MRLKSILPALVFVTTLSCAHVGPIASCATDLVVQVIQSDLGGSDWEGKIESDVLKYGVGVIDCVVNAIIAQAESRSGGAEPVVQHAKAYRAKHADSTKGVSLKSPGDDQVPPPPLAYGTSQVPMPPLAYGTSGDTIYVDAIGRLNVSSFLTNDDVIATTTLDGYVTLQSEPPARSLEEFMCRRASCSVER